MIAQNARETNVEAATYATRYAMPCANDSLQPYRRFRSNVSDRIIQYRTKSEMRLPQSGHQLLTQNSTEKDQASRLFIQTGRSEPS
jgi:hypothetical protein